MSGAGMSGAGMSGNGSDGGVRPAPWTVESSRVEYRDRFLTHRADRCITERGTVLDPYHVLEMRDWCHVIALTGSGELVMVEEYRHAGGRVVRGLPSGTVESGEDPAAAMPRELAEETGYVADSWIALPAMWANPATQTNRVFGFLALGVRPGAARSLDPGETIDVVVTAAAGVFAAVMSGRQMMSTTHVSGLMMAREYARMHAAADPRLAPLAG